MNFLETQFFLVCSWQLKATNNIFWTFLEPIWTVLQMITSQHDNFEDVNVLVPMVLVPYRFVHFLEY